MVVVDLQWRAELMALSWARVEAQSNLVGPWLFLLHSNHSELGGRDYLLGRRKLFLPCAGAQRAAVRANTPAVGTFPAAIGSESVAIAARRVAAGSIRDGADSFSVASEAIFVFVHTKSAVGRRPRHRDDSDPSVVAIVLLCLSSVLLRPF